MTDIDIINKYKTGDKFKALIDNIPITGVIHIGAKGNGDTGIWFCHSNHDLHQGNDSPDKHGYLKSWKWDKQVKDLIITPTDIPINNNYELY